MCVIAFYNGVRERVDLSVDVVRRLLTGLLTAGCVCDALYGKGAGGRSTAVGR